MRTTVWRSRFGISLQTICEHRSPVGGGVACGHNAADKLSLLSIRGFRTIVFMMSRCINLALFFTVVLTHLGSCATIRPEHVSVEWSAIVFDLHQHHHALIAPESDQDVTVKDARMIITYNNDDDTWAIAKADRDDQSWLWGFVKANDDTPWALAGTIGPLWESACHFATPHPRGWIAIVPYTKGKGSGIVYRRQKIVLVSADDMQTVLDLPLSGYSHGWGDAEIEYETSLNIDTQRLTIHLQRFKNGILVDNVRVCYRWDDRLNAYRTQAPENVVELLQSPLKGHP